MDRLLDPCHGGGGGVPLLDPRSAGRDGSRRAVSLSDRWIARQKVSFSSSSASSNFQSTSFEPTMYDQGGAAQAGNEELDPWRSGAATGWICGGDGSCSHRLIDPLPKETGEREGGVSDSNSPSSHAPAGAPPASGCGPSAAAAEGGGGTEQCGAEGKSPLTLLR